VVEPDSPEQLAAAIRDAAAHAAELPAMGARARDIVNQTYSFDRAALAYENIIASLSHSA
jgi:glycosyltransferase involved in cell wall biosynthesis